MNAVVHKCGTPGCDARAEFWVAMDPDPHSGYTDRTVAACSEHLAPTVEQWSVSWASVSKIGKPARRIQLDKQ